MFSHYSFSLLSFSNKYFNHFSSDKISTPLFPIKDVVGFFVGFLCIFLSRDDGTHAESINSDLQRGLDRRLRHNTIEHRTEPVNTTATPAQRATLAEFLQILIPTDRTNGTRTRATQILTYKFVEICSTPLTTAPRRLECGR